MPPTLYRKHQRCVPIRFGIDQSHFSNHTQDIKLIGCEEIPNYHEQSKHMPPRKTACESYPHQIYKIFTHRGRDKMDAISHTTLSDAFSWMKMLEFRLLFFESQYLNQWWLIYWRIYASLGLNDLSVYPLLFHVVYCIGVSIVKFTQDGMSSSNTSLMIHHNTFCGSDAFIVSSA